jgi:hypothetical protein
MLGVVSGAAMMFDGRVESTLTIGEGAETVLAPRQLGFAPAWALGSVGIGRFPVVPGIDELPSSVRPESPARSWPTDVLSAGGRRGGECPSSCPLKAFRA